MDINKLNSLVSDTQSSGQSHKAGVASGAQQAAKAPQSDKTASDKVSLDAYRFRSDEQFAKSELDKLSKSSFDKVRAMKSQLVAYEKAASDSPEAARNTELGAKLNDPDVWKSIAERLLNTR